MSSTELTATLNFLADAGHLLATTAPETSAFLMSQRNGLLFENEVPQSDVQRQHVCSCCGHIMIPGNGSILKIEHKKALEKKSRSTQRVKKQVQEPGPRPGPSKVLTCGHCSRVTKINLPAPTPISRRKIKPTQATATTASAVTSSTLAQTPQEAPAQKVTANANSKRRAKSRKAGLQALLDQKATQTRPGLGLSLADFMKK